MWLCVMKSKIHNATVTEANLYYQGSVTIDPILMEESGIVEGERVQIVNVNNGARIETYVIKGVRGSGTICLNGPAARLFQPGDKVHIIAYAWVTPEEHKTMKPIVVILDDNNKVREKKFSW